MNEDEAYLLSFFTEQPYFTITEQSPREFALRRGEEIRAILVSDNPLPLIRLAARESDGPFVIMMKGVPGYP